MKVVIIECMGTGDDQEYILGVPTKQGFVPFFTRSEDEVRSKAVEVFGEDVMIQIDYLND